MVEQRPQSYVAGSIPATLLSAEISVMVARQDRERMARVGIKMARVVRFHISLNFLKEINMDYAQATEGYRNTELTSDKDAIYIELMNARSRILTLSNELEKVKSDDYAMAQIGKEKLHIDAANITRMQDFSATDYVK